MNIFFTNSDPILTANDHNNIHMIKMITEHNQLLSAAHHVIDGSEPDGAYKLTHKNHPSAIWVRQSLDHYNWLVACTQRLCEIYTIKSGKVHAGEAVLKLLKTPPKGLVSIGFKKPPVAAPDRFKLMSITKGVEVAYQHYLNEKYKEWLGRDKPMKVEWVLDKPSWVVDFKQEDYV